jgi:hypothetical protein
MPFNPAMNGIHAPTCAHDTENRAGQARGLCTKSRIDGTFRRYENDMPVRPLHRMPDPDARFEKCQRNSFLCRGLATAISYDALPLRAFPATGNAKTSMVRATPATTGRARHTHFKKH